MKFIRLTEYYDNCPVYKSMAPGTLFVPMEHSTRIVSPGDVITEEYDPCLYVTESVPEIMRLLSENPNWDDYIDEDRAAVEKIWKTPISH